MARNSSFERVGRPPLAGLLLVLTLPGWAWGHPSPNSAVVLRLRPDRVDAELTLPIVELSLGWDRPLPADAAAAARDHGGDLARYVLGHVRPVAPDGRPWSVRVVGVGPGPGAEPDVRVDLAMGPPPGAPADRLTLHYDAIFHSLITHSALVTLVEPGADAPILLGTLRDTDPAIVVDRSAGAGSRGFAAMFRLGMRHIAEGTDHLLFLLALILPSPLLAAGGRWGGYAGWRAAAGRIVKVATAFTVGHSITLAFGAAGWAHLPEVWVESAIAGSILVSAVHAMVPIFRGRETWIAGGFGLVHGLAFASGLDPFGLGALAMAAGVLGFNLGIEAVQLLVIAAAMPWLVLLARTPAYAPLRVAGAALTAVAALAWIAERAFGRSNPVAPVVEGLAARAPWLLGGLAGLAVVATLVAPRRPAPAIPPDRA